MKIDPEDFESWRAHPITEALFKACSVWSGQAKQLWVERSWESGVNNDDELHDLRGQAKALIDIQDVTAERLEEAINGKT